MVLGRQRFSDIQLCLLFFKHKIQLVNTIYCQVFLNGLILYMASSAHRGLRNHLIASICWQLITIRQNHSSVEGHLRKALQIQRRSKEAKKMDNVGFSDALHSSSSQKHMCPCRWPWNSIIVIFFVIVVVIVMIIIFISIRRRSTCAHVGVPEAVSLSSSS